MKYFTIIAIIDGQPDNVGDILTPNVEISDNGIPVSMNFDKQYIGLAQVTKDGDRLIAEIEIFDENVPIESMEALTGVIGGIIIKKNGSLITEWKLTDIGLTLFPCDKRLPKLKRKTIMNDWPIDERCGCPFLNHSLECTREKLMRNPRKWGEGLRGQIEKLELENKNLRTALKRLGIEVPENN